MIWHLYILWNDCNKSSKHPSALIVTKHLFPYDENFKIHPLSNFQIYNTVLLTIVIMLYITPPGLIFFITASLNLLTPFTHCTDTSHSPSLSTINQFSVLYICELGFLFVFCFVLDSTCRWDYTVFVFLWLISLSIMPSRSVHVVPNGKVSFFFNGWIIFHCISIPYFLYPFIHPWTLKLFPSSGYCKQCCYEHEYINIFSISLQSWDDYGKC